MKIFKKLIFALPLFFLSSCSNNGGGGGGVTPEQAAALADATAFGETYFALSEACPMCAGGPWGQIGIIGAASVIAADASGAFGRSTNEIRTNGKSVDISLEQSFIVPDNIFEQYGNKHNIGLDFLNKLPNLEEFTQKISNYNDTAWIALLNVEFPEITLAEKNHVIQFARDNDIVNKLKNHSGFFDSRDGHPFDTYINNSSFSIGTRQQLLHIKNEYNRLLSDKTNYTDELNYLNTQITSRIKIEDPYSAEEAAVLSFLTVLKHSTFYWYK